MHYFKNNNNNNINHLFLLIDMATSGDPNSKSDTNIIKQHHDKLFNVLVLVGRDDFISFVVNMYSGNIVRTLMQKNSIINSSKRGDGVNELLTEMEVYVSMEDEREREERQKRLLKLMEEMVWLKDTVKQIKQGIY